MILDEETGTGYNNSKSRGGVVVGYEYAMGNIAEGHTMRLGACPGNGGSVVYPDAANLWNYHMGFWCGPSVEDMKALDSKLDDGRPYSGTVSLGSGRHIYRVPASGVDETSQCAVSATNTYRYSTTPYFYCALEIKMRTN
jgi:hypothetical protein